MIKATPRQNAIAVVLIFGVLGAVGVRLWASTGLADVRGPEYIALDNERVYVQTSRRIFELNALGELQRSVDISALRLTPRVSGLQVLGDGRLLIGDARDGRVRRCDLSSRQCDAVGPNDSRAIWQNFKFFWDEAGQKLYLTDGERHRLLVQDGNAGGIRELGERDTLRFPNKVTVDASGIVHVADTNHHRLVSFEISGNTLREVGAISAKHPQARPGHDWPVDFARDDAGRWWVLNSDGFLDDPDLLAFDRNGKPEKRLTLPNGGRPFALAMAAGQLLVTDNEVARVYRVDTENGAVQEFGDAKFRESLAQLHRERSHLKLASEGGMWSLGALLAMGIALAVSVIRGRSGEVPARKLLPIAPMPMARLTNVRWLDPDPAVVKKLKIAMAVAAAGILPLPILLYFLSASGTSSKVNPPGELLHIIAVLVVLFLLVGVTLFLGIRMFRSRIGASGSLLCLADHRGMALAVPPEEVFYSERAVAYGPFFVAIKTGHGEPLFPPAAFERDIRPLLDRAQKVGAVNLQIYQLMQGQRTQIAILVLLVVSVLLLFVPKVLPGF